MKDLNVSRVEMDELWIIEKKSLQEAKLIKMEWMWVSFAPESRLIVDFIIGSRKQYLADILIEVTDKHLSDSKPIFITNRLKFYAEALLKK